MTRDELIEELKKAPSNGEVEITAHILIDCPDCGTRYKPRDKFWLKIHRVSTIPNIQIETDL